MSQSGTGTFSAEDKLPNLAVPRLETTIEKYLYSIKAVATAEEYKKTSHICEKFLMHEGIHLQKKLKEIEKTQRNWIEQIWLEKGYLELRIPLPYLNFSGISSYSEQFWPLKSGAQIERAAWDMHLLCKFWKMLHNEEMKPHKSSKGAPFSMHQLRTTFNTCRIPKRKMDSLDSHFKTVNEGTAPSHAIVICKGHLFRVDTIDHSTGEPFSPPRFEQVLNEVNARSSLLPEAPGVAALTSLDRDTWADIRERLINISETNRRTMNDIETSVYVLSLDDANPQTFTEMMRLSLNGDPCQRWRDKSYNAIWTSNGAFAASCDHTALDGMIMVMYIHFVTTSMQSCGGVWKDPLKDSRACSYEELSFDLDDEVTSAIANGKAVAAKFRDDIELFIEEYDAVGKVELKQNKIYPDAFVQICIQLAYMRLHGKPAPTYETATTRQFYHGRTETCRTCIPELVRFCRVLIDGGDRSETQKLLQTAHDRLLWLMEECRNNRGCDRHLFGLSLAAAEEGSVLPELFTDPMYTKSGGGGNFVLSTSFVGFLESNGATTPMVDDGYGVFYRINDHRIVVTLTAWRYSTVTNTEKFRAYIADAITDVYDLFRSKNTSHL